jgi:general secretion pathway protein A
MYKSFYGLKASPFQISTDPTFLWLGEKHREAIAMLKYGIQVEDHTGMVLLTGDTGTGKTTLINALFKSLDRGVIRAAVKNPSLEGMDFFNYIAASFGNNRLFSTKNRFLLAFEQYLKNAAANGKKVLLVIDEAQVLTDTMLREIRLFANFEQDGRNLIRIFLVGQTELRKKLARPANQPLAQRITLNYHIEPLMPEETREYIQYRLQVAGTSRPVFSPEAVQQVHRYSRGLPRQINILCDHALLTGYVGNHSQISGDIIEECAGEVSITRVPEPPRKRPDVPGPFPGKALVPGPPSHPGQAPPSSQALFTGQADAGTGSGTGRNSGPKPPPARNRQTSRSLQNKTDRPDLAEAPPAAPKKTLHRGYLILVALAVLAAAAAAGLFFL